MAVVGYHYFPGWIKGGFVGVDIFFVISGYLISGILLDSLKNNNFSIINFYQRRILRILPALILVMVAVLVFGWFALLPDEYAQLGKHIAGGSAFISNFILYFESGYWDTASNYKPLLHLWSLGVEEQFYIIFPVILFVLHKLGLRKSFFIALLFIVSFALNLYYYKADMTLDFYMPFTRFWELMAGSMIALSQREKIGLFHNLIANIDRSKALKQILSLLGLALMLYGVLAARGNGHPPLKIIVPVVGASLFIVAGGNAFLNRYLFSLKPIVFIGLISFPLYLWHWSLISCSRIVLWNYNGIELPMTLVIVLAIMSIVLAILTYYFIEKPIRFSKSRRGSKTIALVVLLAIMGAVGAGIYIKGGISDRWLVRALGENVEAQLNEMKLMRTSQSFNQPCFARYGFKKIIYMLRFCVLTDVNSTQTTAIIGDSHAQSSYDSIAMYNAQKGINTVLLGCGDAHGGLIARTSISSPNLTECANRVLGAVQTDKTINKVFIVLYKTEVLSVDDLQTVIDKIKMDNREIFIVEENPVLPHDIRTYLFSHPFVKSDKNVHYLTRSEILEQRKESRKMLAELKGATIIYTIDVFCPIDQCLLTDENGLPLYVDDDHLSLNAGGNFLINHALKPYLDK
ncbi:acyltransferase [Campylobacterota bacterium]|nr:acyltransferase [Campylobacterota bacterium]